MYQNRVTLIGFLGEDAEVKSTRNNASFTVLSLATKRSWKDRETEAEAVAFGVCEAIGLDTNTASADYISLYSGDKATLAESLHFIQSTTGAILTAITAVANPVP